MNKSTEQLEDPKFYLESFCKIKTKKGGLAPFILNEAQKDLFNTLAVDNRIIILKARQIGFSTAATGWIYHKTITTPGTNSAIIGYNGDLTKELLDKVKMFYSSTPIAMRPTIQYNSKTEITFPKINSKIMILPSTENVGRGYTFQNVLATELSMWEKADEKMVALENSVPIDGKIIVESTPNGVGNLYHKMWMTDNDYRKKEYGWWWLYTEEEIETIRRRMNNPMKFAQEYGLEFLASGRLVFGEETINRQREKIWKAGQPYESEDRIYIPRMEDEFIVYKDPVEGRQYVAGVDTSEGVTGGDYSVCVFFDRTTGEEVAFYRGHIAPDKLAEKIDKWGRRYNNALMTVEANNHGLVTLTVLKQLIYPTLYFRPAKFDTISNPWSDKLGWKTTVMTRPILIDEFNQVMRDGHLTIHTKEITDEMSVFIFDRQNAMVAQEGFHDDCIFAAAIAFQGFKVLYDKKLDQINYSAHLPDNYSY